MKLKILSGVIIAIIVAITVIITTTSRSEGIDSTINNSSSEPDSKKSAPEKYNEKDLSKMTHESTSIKSDPAVKKKDVSFSDLAGPVHNNYGIRDDILEYIEKTIPHWNKKAWKAVTTIAATEQFLNYIAQTDEEAQKASERIILAMKCLAREYPDNDTEDYRIFKQIEKLMANTRERQLHLWEVNGKHFAGKHYDRQDLSDEQIIKACEEGSY